MSHRRLSPSAKFSRARLYVILLTLFALFSFPACEPTPETGEDGGSTEITDAEAVDTGDAGEVEQIEPTAEDMGEWPTPPPPRTQSPTSRPDASDRGDFIARYVPVSNPNFAEVERVFREARILEDIAGDLNQTFSLPHDVPINFRECGEPNAFYDPTAKEIHMCYEFVALIAQLNMRYGASREEAVEGIKGALYFTFYHEIGHALVDVLDLPVTGQQEELADELSAFVLTHKRNVEGETLVLNGAKFWLLLADARKKSGEGNSPWDEHLSDEQRFYNLTCFLYGSNPSKFGHLVPSMLPPPRAAKCPADYSRLVKGWVHALGPFLKS
ncbi:MAG TPA: DUF4344 domain-containing metallopeptidase [Pyrinomonadaceae bacterium]|nr:DUF4344 domain-containing metallopeptidase [Pyrinomonadaceae bacterium]